MSDLLTFWYPQLVDAPHLNKIGIEAQAADRNLYIDLLPFGIANGQSVAQVTPTPNLTVNVTAGQAYDQTGQRCYIPSTQNINLAVDSNGVSTLVSGAANSKIVSVFVQFARNNQTAFVDGNSVPGFEDNLESFKFVVVQGTEAVSPTPPTLSGSMILLADVTRVYNQTQIVTANIDLVTRRQLAWTVSGTTYTSPRNIQRGTVYQAMQDFLSYYNGHVSGSIDKHLGTGIVYGGSGVWVNGLAGLAAGTVDSAITAAVAALASTTNAASGADKVGSAAFTTGTVVTAAGSVWQQLGAVANATGSYKTVSPAFADSSTLAAAALSTWLDSFVSKIASTSSSDGAGTIGAKAIGGLPAGTVRSQLSALDTNKAPLASPTFTGTVTLPGPPALTTPANWYRHAYYVAMTTVAGDLVSGYSSVFTGTVAGTIPSLQSSLQTAATHKAVIYFSPPPQGAVANSLTVVATGIGFTAPLSLGTYQLVQINPATGAETLLSGAVADNHNAAGGNWSTTQTTAVALTGGQFTVDNSLGIYALILLLPSSGGAGARVEVNDILLTGTAAVLALA